MALLQQQLVEKKKPKEVEEVYRKLQGLSVCLYVLFDQTSSALKNEEEEEL